jgi:hypothetical protein
VSEPIYSRAPDVVWRLAPDRVLVRRIGRQGNDAAAELVGEAALAWITLDEPGTGNDMVARGLDGGLRADLDAAIDQLEVQAWIWRSPS